VDARGPHGKPKFLKDRLKLRVAELGRQALKRLLHCHALPIAKKRLVERETHQAWTVRPAGPARLVRAGGGFSQPGSPSICTDRHQPARVGWTRWASALYQPLAVTMLDAEPSRRPTSRPLLSCHVSHLPSRARRESDAKPLGERCGCATAAGSERPSPEHLDHGSAGSGREAAATQLGVGRLLLAHRACAEPASLEVRPMVG
jgi:hypothetical protein